MSHRKKRLQKLVDLRSREVDDRLGKLAEARKREDLAKQLVEREEAKLNAAREERASAISRPFEVSSLTLSNDWMVSCARRADLSRQVLEKARQTVQQAQDQVL